MSPEEFDKQYMAWLDKRVGKTAANFDEWREQLKALVAMSEKKDDDAVIAAAPAVIAAVSGVCGGCECVRVSGGGAAGQGRQAGCGGCADGVREAGRREIRRR